MESTDWMEIKYNTYVNSFPWQSFVFIIQLYIIHDQYMQVLHFYIDLNKQNFVYYYFDWNENWLKMLFLFELKE
jgi:hypothetical protein